MQTPTISLQPEQVAFFRREGYLVLPPVTTEDEIARLRRILLHLFEVKAGRQEGNHFDMAGTDEDDAPANLPQIHTPAKYAPELEDSRFRATAVALAHSLLGPDAVLDFEHAILKPAQVGYETAWHQDEAFWNPAMDYEALTIWMPLHEATLENGCLHFIPGSHQKEVQPHHTLHHDPRIHALEADYVDTARAVACPIPAGAVTVHHCRTLHYAGPNCTAAPRLSYALVLGIPPRARAVKRDFYWQALRETAAHKRMKAALARTTNQS